MDAVAAPAWPGRAVTLGALVLLGGSLLLLVLGLATTNDAGARVGVVPPEVAVATVAAALVAAAAVAATLREGRPTVAAGCLVAAAGGLLPVWATAPPVPAAVGAVLLAAPVLTVPGAAAVGTGWSAGRSRLALVWVLAAVALLVHAAGYDPFRDPGCTVLCDQVAVPAAGLVPTRTLIVLVAALTWAAAATGAAAVWRVRQAAPPAVVATALAALLLAGLAASAPALGDAGPHSLPQALVPGLVAGALPGVGLLVVWWRTHRTRRALREVVQRLGGRQGSVEGLPDPVLGVQVARPDGGWVDVTGVEVPASPPPGSAVPLGPDVRLLVRPGAAGVAEVVGRLGAADLVAVSNARLAALTRAHQREVRESQRRIVTLSDSERLRIERDLHDGAQQRLVAAKLYLRLAEPALPPPQSEQVAEAEQQVQAAIEALRSLAHGAVPTVLQSDGLVAALEELAAGAPVPVERDLDLLPPGPGSLPLAASTALYAAAAASVRAVAESGDAEGLAVRGVARPGWVGVAVAARAAPVPSPARLQQVADRLGAVDGRLTVEQAGEGWTLTAEVPCESP